MRRPIAFVGMFSLVLLVGCGSAYRIETPIKYPPFSPKDDPKIGPINLSEYKFPESSGDLAIKDAANDWVKRNRLQSTILLVSDAMCDRFESRVLAVSNGSNLLTGFLATVLSGAAAVVTGDNAQAILSAGAGVSTATRSLVNDEVYRGKFVQIILDTMNRSRQEKKALIQTQWDKGPGDYTMEQALGDAMEYHEMCSFHRGLTLLATAVDRKTPCDQLREKQKNLLADRATFQQLAGAAAAGTPQAPNPAAVAGSAAAAPAPAQAGDLTTIQRNVMKQLNQIQIQLAACPGGAT
jgi:hypothetical protein